MSLDRDATSGAGGGENYYEVLGLAPGATADEIEAAYEDLSAMFAAGKVPAARQEYARKQRTRLAAAYAILGDPAQRTAYDGRLAPAPADPLNTPRPAEEAAGAMAPGAATAGEPATPVGWATPEEPAPPAPAEDALPPGPVILPWEAPASEVALAEPLTIVEDANEEDVELDYEDAADADADLDYEDDADEEPAEPQPASPPVARFAPSTATAGRPGRSLPAPSSLVPPPAARQPGGASSGVRVEPARPPTRPTGASPAPRTGGVALPTRREAALIAAQRASAPAEPPPLSARAVSAPRRPLARPTRPVEYEEDIRPRGRLAPPAPVRRKRSRKVANQFAYQVMVLVIALVLIVGTAAQVLSGTIAGGGSPTAGTATANPVNLVSSGNALVAQQNWTVAEQVFQQALQSQPTNVNAMLGLVHVYQGRHNPGDSGLAQNYAQQIIKTDPNSAAAREALGVLNALSLTPQVSPSAAPAAGASAIQPTGVLTNAPAGAPTTAPRAAPPTGATGGPATPRP